MPLQPEAAADGTGTLQCSSIRRSAASQTTTDAPVATRLQWPRRLVAGPELPGKPPQDGPGCRKRAPRPEGLDRQAREHIYGHEGRLRLPLTAGGNRPERAGSEKGATWPEASKRSSARSSRRIERVPDTRDWPDDLERQGAGACEAWRDISAPKAAGASDRAEVLLVGGHVLTFQQGPSGRCKIQGTGAEGKRRPRSNLNGRYGRPSRPSPPAETFRGFCARR
jgi:hypothetical protein